MQLLQVYARLAELEIAAGERPREGEVAPPEDTAERIRGWADGEEGKVKEGKELLAQLVPGMEAMGFDTGSVKAVIGG